MDWMLLDHCACHDKFTLFLGGRCTLGFDIEGWRHQEEEMACCLREHCVRVPPLQLYRCLKFTGVSPCPGNTHQFSVGRHFLWADISTWVPNVLTWTNAGLFGRIHKPDVISAACCSGCCLLGVLVRDVTPLGYRIRQKPVIKLWAGEMGVISYWSPLLHLWPLVFPWQSQSDPS